jgi:NAD(P)-dependent dehydrogenase (short-subunit alcohol dehydrogenase family)
MEVVAADAEQYRYGYTPTPRCADQYKVTLVSTVLVKHLAAPEEIARVIAFAFLASKNATYVTGTSIQGGWRGLAD